MRIRIRHSTLWTARWLSGLLALLAFVGGNLAAYGQGALSAAYEEALSQRIHDVWTIEDGLPQNTVNALAQTSDGYLWLGTEEGLVRFNGLEFVVFDGTTTAVFGSHAHISALAVDHEGALWIGAGENLIRYDGDTFASVALTAAGPPVEINTLHVDAAGTLWVGTSDGLFRNDGTRFETADLALPSSRVTAVYATETGTVWIGTDAGLVRVVGNTTTVFTEADGLPDAFIHTLHQDQEGRLWIGTRGGVRRVEGDTIVPEAVPGHLVDVPVFTFHSDTQGTLWVGTDSDGLYRLRNSRMDSFTSTDGLLSNRIVALYEDQEGSLWFGTEGGGLNRLRKSKFVTLNSAEGLSHDMALAVFEDAQQTLWIGTEGGGLNRIHQGQVMTYTTADGLPSNVVLSLQDGPDGALWIGTYGGGLSRLHDGHFTTHSTQTGFLSDAVFALHRGRSGVLWIGTSAGVARYDGTDFTYLTQADGLSSNQVTALHEDRDGALWIGTFDAGLNRYYRGELTTYRTADGLGDETIMALYEDHNGTLWVGTYGGGLTRIQNGALHTVTAEQGLFSNTIYQILEDDANNLWMSCNKGLFRASLDDLNAAAEDSATVPITVFGKEDGLRSREMNGGVQPAGWKGQDGTLWFPTIQGVAGINPERAWHNLLPPPIAIEAILVDREPRPLEGDLHLAPGRKKIEFTYAALTFVAPELAAYRYKLDGYDETWTDAGVSRVATYTNLSPGTYTFRVMARNSDGVWSTEAATVTFYLKPFFYQRPLFWISLALVLLLLSGLAYRLRVHHLKARQQELEAQVDARTADLQAAKERIERQAKQLQELDRFKTRFFANISHEFRTPLTLMIGPLENALSGAYGGVGDALGEQLQVMLRNAMRLLRLINQLLDLSKLESGKMTLRPRARNLVTFLEGIAASFTAYVEQKQIALTIQVPTDHLELYYEPDKLEKVFFNLLSNAVKYTPEGGTITFVVTELDPTTEAPEGAVQVQVRDTGPGIPADHLPYVFDRFHRVDDSNTRQYEGTGIGLSLVKELILLHGGTVTAASAPGEGATFTVTLLKGNAHFAPDRIDTTADVENDGLDLDPGAMAEMATAEFNAMVRGDHAPTEMPAQPHPTTPAPKHRVLVVDDNTDIRDYIRSCIQDLCQVAEATDGQHGLEQAATFRPDLIISDIMMPRMNGYEFCGHIKSDPALQHIPVILLSAKTSQQTILQGLEVGADEYLAKPFNARELRVRIQNLLKLRAQERELKAWNEHLQEKVEEQLQLILQEREAYEARLLAEKEKAEEAALLKTTILNNMSHEFRTPITGIIGSADILAMELQDADMQELVGFIQTNGKRLMDTLTALLELAHLEADAAQPRSSTSPLQVVNVVEDVVKRFQRDADRKGVQLHFHPARPDLQAALDAALVTRVAQVLIDNAVKFTDAGQITVELGEQKTSVYLRVRDTGIGIGDDFLPHVFDAFRQESAGDNRSHEGTGLGLTIAKRLVDLADGTIEVESARGRGSVFTVRLPRGSASASPSDASHRRSSAPTGR